MRYRILGTHFLNPFEDLFKIMDKHEIDSVLLSKYFDSELQIYPSIIDKNFTFSFYLLNRQSTYQNFKPTRVFENITNSQIHVNLALHFVITVVILVKLTTANSGQSSLENCKCLCKIGFDIFSDIRSLLALFIFSSAFRYLVDYLKKIVSVISGEILLENYKKCKFIAQAECPRI